MPLLNRKNLTLIFLLLIVIAILVWLKLRSRPLMPTPFPIPSPSSETNLPILSPPTFLAHPSLSPLPPQTQIRLPQAPSLPSSLVTYQFISAPISDYSSIATRLNFTAQPTSLKQYLSWGQGKNSLVINTTSSQLNLITTLPNTVNFSDELSLKSYASQLINQISESSIWDNPSLTISYYSGSEESLVITQNPASATSVKIYATPSIDPYPLYSFTLNPTQITIDAEVKSVAVSFPLASGHITPQSPYPLININQLTPEFLITNSRIITPTTNPPLSTTITSISLAYFFDPTQTDQVIQPILVLSDGANLTAYLPAINPNFLLAP